uniref:Interleukin-11 n=1 Tax=Neogobius melanostomus TaxID=47308 RepID=A0A8C6TYE3_9GOBI
ASLFSSIAPNEFIALSLSRPAHSPALCALFGSMAPQVERLLHLSKKLHDLTDEELNLIAAADHRLDGLPRIPHTAAAFNTMKMNESISQLYNFTEVFRSHMDWLKTARENVSLPNQAAEGASRHLLQLAHLLNSTLHQVGAVPQPSPLSLPVASSAFDALKFSVEISENLKAFSLWTKRSIRFLQRQSRCPRR